MRWQEGEVAVSVILSSKRKTELLKAWKLSEGQDWKLIHDSLIRMLMFIELQDFSHLLSSKMKKNGMRESFLFCLFPGSWELTRKLCKEEQHVAKQSICSVSTGADEVPLHLLAPGLCLKAAPLTASLSLQLLL